MPTVLIIAALVVLALTVGMQVAFKRIEKNLKGLKNLPIAKIDLSKIPDGDYPGSFSAFPVKAEVLVRVRGGRVDRVDIVKHSNGQGRRAEAIPSRAVEKQDIDVDAVSGATYSSVVIKKAMENALKSAGR